MTMDPENDDDDDDYTWGFVMGALGMCTTVNGREFRPGDLARDRCIQWHAPFYGSPTINFGGVTLYLRDEICRRYLGNHDDVVMACGKEMCLNPRHFSVKRQEPKPGAEADSGGCASTTEARWEHLDANESLLLRTALWAKETDTDPAPGLGVVDPMMFLMPRARLFYEMALR